MSTLKTCFWLWLLATPVLAGGAAADPTYIGLRSNNPEQETYGVPVDSSAFARPLAFVGPARSIGPATGDPEKDTVTYSPLVIDPRGCPICIADVELK